MRWAVPLVLLAAVITHDLTVRTGHGLGARAALFVIDEYRAHVSPRMGSVLRCRFRPTCSSYGKQAITKYGLLHGGAKTAWRIARCNPLTPVGTVDRP